MGRKLILAIYCTSIFFLINCAGPKEAISYSTATTRPSLTVAEILAQLNYPKAEDIDVFTCPNRHPPNYFPSGEVISWVITREEKLKKMGVFVRWDCETQAFEITTKDNSTSKCGCP